MQMLDSIGQVSSLLCYRQESVDIFGDVEEFFEYQCDLTVIKYQEILRSITSNYTDGINFWLADVKIF